MDADIVGHVIAEIVHRGGVDRGEPDGVNVQALDVVQPLADAVQVADAVAVAVLERARVDLVDDSFLPPKMCDCHGLSLLW